MSVAPGPAAEPAGRSPRRWTPTLRFVVAVGGGVLWALCFGRSNLVAAPWIALVPLILLLDGRRAALAAFLHGVAFWLAAIPWIEPTLRSYGGLPPPLAWGVLAALAVYLASFQLIFGALGGRLWRRSGALAPAATAALWVGLEWLRAHLFTGFPWNLAAYAVPLPGVLSLSPWVGAYGVSFLVVLVNASIARSWSLRAWRPAAAGVAPALALVAVATVWNAAARPSSPPPGRQVHLVQPNPRVSTVYDPEAARRDYLELLRMSSDACSAAPGLLVWPESAAWPFSPERHPFLRRDLDELARRGCPVLLNAATFRGDRSYNSVLLVQTGGRTATADKRHLVPFGEYVPAPFRRLPFVGKVARHVGDFSPGASVELLPWEEERLGVSVCYEVIFPSEVAVAVRRGATALVTITNDGWYGDSSAPWQHFRAARFRAAENRRPMLRAALTGISAFVAPDGSVTAWLGVGARGVISGRLAGSERAPTVTARLPWLVPLAASFFAAFAILRPIRR